MADNIQFIVRSLNAPPFSVAPPLTLMSFDRETSPLELLQLLGTILQFLDEKSFPDGAFLDDGEAAIEAETYKVMDFLYDLRYPVVFNIFKGKSAEQKEAYAARLGSGERET